MGFTRGRRPEVASAFTAGDGHDGPYRGAGHGHAAYRVQDALAAVRSGRVVRR